MEGRFKITFFLKQSIKELTVGLKGLGFVPSEKKLRWTVGEKVFDICPFTGEKRHDEPYGYRAFFNGTVGGGLYLYDLSVAVYKPIVAAVEYTMSFGDTTRQEWIQHFNQQRTLNEGPLEGTYNWNGIYLSVLPDQLLFMVRAKKNKKLNINECVKRIEAVKEEVIPQRFDLFSFMD